MNRAWNQLEKRVIACRRCERLRGWCDEVARTKRAAFRDETYWGKPVPNFGDPAGRLLIVGLAPAAHGANRTGRMFTGDRSGDFLYEAMHRTGFANQPTATHRGDGLELTDIAIAASARCAPPANKPTPEELDNCFEFLTASAAAMPNLRGVIALGSMALDSCVRLYRTMNWSPMKPKPRFGHGALYRFENAPFLLCTYHPSQQNTFTGKLTMHMLVAIFQTARDEVEAITSSSA